jgi:Alpha/beta hydrolase family
MAAGEAQLTEFPGQVVTGPGGDQDGMTRPAGTRPASGTTAVLPLPGAGLVHEVTGDGPAVVLVHGFGLDMRMWEPQVGHLAARFRVVRYDCRGFGASGPFDPAVPYTHAGDLVALLDHLDIGEAVRHLAPPRGRRDVGRVPDPGHGGAAERGAATRGRAEQRMKNSPRSTSRRRPR